MTTKTINRKLIMPGCLLKLRAQLKKTFCLLAGTLFFYGCSLQKAANMANCDYSIDTISAITWAGIDLSRIKSYSDLTMSQALNLTKAISNQDYTLHFTINVLAANNTQKPAELSGFDYQILLDGKKIAEGNSNSENNIRLNTGDKITIPVVLRVNMLDFLSAQNIENMINAGKNFIDFGTGKPSKITFKFRPWVKKTKMPYISLSKTIQ